MPDAYDVIPDAKVYRCHDYFVTGGRGLVGFFAFLIGLTWLLPVLSLASRGVVSSYAPGLAVSLSFTLTCLLLLALFINREIRQIRYIVAADSLTRAGSASRSTVRFAEVTALRRGRFGSVEVRGLDGVVRIPFIVAGLPALIDDLRERLAEAGNGDATEIGDLDELRRRALVSSWSTARLQHAFPRFWALGQGLFVTGVITARFLWHWPFFLAVAWSMAGLVAPVASLAAADFLLSLRARSQKPGGEEIPRIDEDRMLIGAAVAALLLYLIAGIAARIAFSIWIIG